MRQARISGFKRLARARVLDNLLSGSRSFILVLLLELVETITDALLGLRQQVLAVDDLAELRVLDVRLRAEHLRRQLVFQFCR